jgi:hypothetical protein
VLSNLNSSGYVHLRLRICLPCRLQEEWEEFKRAGLVPVTARTPADEEDEVPAESGWQDGMPPTPKKPAKAAPKPDYVRIKPGVEAFIPDDLNLEKVGAGTRGLEESPTKADCKRRPIRIL